MVIAGKTIPVGTGPQAVGAKKFLGFLGQNMRSKVRPQVPSISKIRELANPKPEEELPAVNSPATPEKMPQPIRNFIEYAIKPSAMQYRLPQFYNLSFLLRFLLIIITILSIQTIPTLQTFLLMIYEIAWLTILCIGVYKYDFFKNRITTVLNIVLECIF